MSTTGEHLIGALKKVDWNRNVGDFCGSDKLVARFESCNLRLAHWARQIEIIDKDNPALPFVREMQHGGHNVACCVSVGLYKPAASSMRSLLECAMYYTYFRTHPSELKTLLVEDKFYVAKRDIIIFYQKHVRHYANRQNSINFGDRLEKWYSETSAIVHGQIPGSWSLETSIEGVCYSNEMAEKVIHHFERAAQLVQDTFICTLGEDLWPYVETNAKKYFLHGISPEIRLALKLDQA